MLSDPQQAKTNQLKKIIHTLHQLVVNFLLASRASIEDKVLRSVQLMCWITQTASAGLCHEEDPSEVINLGLAALDSPLKIVPRRSSTRKMFSLPLAQLSHSQSSRF